jgi:chromosome segregation ATPase
MSDIESQNLAAHVGICEQRYLNLEGRINDLAQRMEKIENMVCDIRDHLQEITERQNKKWDGAQTAVISLLASAVAFLLVKTLF